MLFTHVYICDVKFTLKPGVIDRRAQQSLAPESFPAVHLHPSLYDGIRGDENNKSTDRAGCRRVYICHS
jgi:hypothetical protein